MSGRKKIVLILVVAFVAAVVAFWPGKNEPPEPVYNGMKLSEWIGTVSLLRPNSSVAKPGVTVIEMFLIDTHDRSPNEVASAIRHMGTNAVERLIEWVNYEPSSWTKRVSAFEQCLRDRVSKKTMLWFADKREYRAMAAQNALAGLNARDVPMQELHKIAVGTNSAAAKRAVAVMNSFRAADLPMEKFRGSIRY
jgi:hypothetical protein